jgi:hypothetical protein
LLKCEAQSPCNALSPGGRAFPEHRCWWGCDVRHEQLANIIRVNGQQCIPLCRNAIRHEVDRCLEPACGRELCWCDLSAECTAVFNDEVGNDRVSESALNGVYNTDQLCDCGQRFNATRLADDPVTRLREESTAAALSGPLFPNIIDWTIDGRSASRRSSSTFEKFHTFCH